MDVKQVEVLVKVEVVGGVGGVDDEVESYFVRDILVFFGSGNEVIGVYFVSIFFF